MPIASETGTPTDDELKKKNEALRFTVERRELEAPRGLTATPSRGGKMTLSWTHDNRATHYDITKSEGTGASTKIATEKPINELGATCCSYIDSGLKEDVVYTYSVKPYKIVTGSAGYRLKGRSSEIPIRNIASYDIRQAYNAAQFVDTRYATGETIDATGGGDAFDDSFNANIFSGAAYPFGMTVITPTGSHHIRPHGNGERREILSFVTHAVSGMGCRGNLGMNFPFMMHIGDLRTGDLWRLNDGVNALRVKDSNFEGNTIGKPGYFKVEFNNGMIAEMTVSARAGIVQFTLPASASKATFFIITHSAQERHNTRMSIEPRGGQYHY